MKQALGLVEIQGLSTAFVVADTMAKAANVRILEIENTRGLGYMTIKVDGNVGAVTAAVNAGKQIGIENRKLVSWKVIPRPSDYVEHTFADPDGPGSVCPPGYRERKQADKPQVSPEVDSAAKTEPLPQESAVTETGEATAEEAEVTVAEPEAAVEATAAEEAEVTVAEPEAAVEATAAEEAEVTVAEPEAAKDVPEAEPEMSEGAPEMEEEAPETAAEEAPAPAAPEKSKAAPRRKTASSAKGTAADKSGGAAKRKK